DLGGAGLKQGVMLGTRVRTSQNRQAGILASNVAGGQPVPVPFGQCEDSQRCAADTGFLENSFVGGVAEEGERSPAAQSLHYVRIYFDHQVGHMKGIERGAHFAPHTAKAAKYNMFLQL